MSIVAKRNKMLVLEKIVFFITRLVFPLALIFGLPVFLFLFVINANPLKKKLLEDNDLNKDLIYLVAKSMFGFNVSISLVVSVVIGLYLLKYFQTKNSDLVFNSNGKISYSYPYFVFWIASNILGFKKIQLAGLQIPMQFKIILRNTFPEILKDMYFEEPLHRDGICEPQVYYSKNSEKVFLIVEDTYKVNPEEYNSVQKGLATVIISSDVIDSARTINKGLTEEVRKQSFCLSKKFDELHLIMTTNPWNNNIIVNESFRQFGRFGFKRIYVYHLETNRKYIAHRVL